MDFFGFQVSSFEMKFDNWNLTIEINRQSGADPGFPVGGGANPPEGGR